MRVSWAALLPLALAACGSDLPVEVPFSPIHSPGPLLGAASVPSGGAAFVACDTVGLNVRVDPHFYQPAAPFPTYADAGGPAGDCGDLDFDNRTRQFTLIYATAQASESPWKYWWRRGRLANDGTGDGLTEVLKHSVPQFVYATDTIDIPLNSQHDAITALLLISSDGTIALNDSAFTSAQAGNPLFDAQNVNVQHWRHIDSPVLDSVKANGTAVTLWWTNHFFTPNGRIIDSTNIFRNGTFVGVVGPSATTYPDNVSGSGTFTYQLKHVSTPHGILVSASPNSPGSNTLQVTIGTACARLAESSGSTNTWKLTDQYLSAGCSELGANKRFRWYSTGGVVLTGWTTDTLLEFSGHSSAGAQVVVLKDSNTTSHATSLDTLAFSVTNHRVVLSGPTIIQDKTKKIYRAYRDAAPTTHRGQWFERYEGTWQWYPATSTMQDTLARIWPMGEYTMELRQHRDSLGIHRGRLHIEVCSSPGSQCEQNAPPAGLNAAASQVEAEVEWGLFGAGPWIGWGAGATRRTLRLYDLWGAHDRDTPFSAAPWIDGMGGTFTDPEAGWTVTWTRRDLGIADAAAFEVTISGGGTRSYVFGLAADPDLGPNAADDQASYDAARGLVLVADRTQAVGFLLRQRGDNALTSVQEYGVGRWAPTTSDAAWTAQRAGIQLVGTPRDVQLVLSTPQTVGSGMWQLVVLRGATPAALRASADVVLDRLR